MIRGHVCLSKGYFCRFIWQVNVIDILGGKRGGIEKRGRVCERERVQVVRIYEEKFDFKLLFYFLRMKCSKHFLHSRLFKLTL